MATGYEPIFADPNLAKNLANERVSKGYIRGAPSSVARIYGATRPAPTTRSVSTVPVRAASASRMSPLPFAGNDRSWSQFEDWRDDPASGSFASGGSSIPHANGTIIANKDQSRLTPNSTAFADTPLTNPAQTAIADALRGPARGVPGHGQTAYGRMPIDNSVPLNMPQPAAGMAPMAMAPAQNMTRREQRRAMIAARPRKVEDNPLAARARAQGRRSYTNDNGALMPLTSIGGGARNTYGD